jgi:hypothetical protein
VTLPNTQIEVDQPDGGSGPAAKYLEKFGQGIYRVGFSTSDAIEPAVAALAQKGGTRSAESRTGTYAYLDFTPTLGTTIEVRREQPRLAAAAPAPAASGNVVLGSTPMSHIGWAVTNVDQFARNLSEILGVKMPTVRPFDVAIPPGYKGDPAATLRVASVRVANAGIELVQSLGGQTNWTDFIGRHGNNSAPQHLAFPVGDKLEETTKLFQSKGAQWTQGKINGMSEYLDFTETLGIIVELDGSWGSPAAAAK